MSVVPNETQTDVGKTLLANIIATGVLIGILFMLVRFGSLLPWIALASPLALLAWRKKINEIHPLSMTIVDMILMPFVIFALGSPAVFFSVMWQRILPGSIGRTRISVGFLKYLGIEPGFEFNVFIACCGIAYGILLLFGIIRLTLRQKKLMDNKSTIRVKDAGPGTREFVGIARHVENESLEKADATSKEIRQFRFAGDIKPILLRRSTDRIGSTHTEQVVRRFYLDDNSVKILVDPDGAEFMETPGGIKQPFTNLRKIIIARRIQTEKIDPDRPALERKTATLLPGDAVYLIGYVAVNSDAPKGAKGVGRLIVKPSRKRLFCGVFHALSIFTLLAAKDTGQTFLLSDTSEDSVKKLLYLHVRRVCLISLIWLAPCPMLLVMSLLRI